MIGPCAKPTPMIRSNWRSANARIAGSIEVGAPGSTSRSRMPRPGRPQLVLPSGSMPVSAHLTPAHAAALNERSSLPPASKTMPTRTFERSSTALVPLQAATNTSVVRQKRTTRIGAAFYLRGTLPDLVDHRRPRQWSRVADGDGVGAELQRRREAVASAMMQLEQRLPGCNGVARTREHAQPHRVIHRRSHRVAAGAE